MIETKFHRPEGALLAASIATGVAVSGCSGSAPTALNDKGGVSGDLDTSFTAAPRPENGATVWMNIGGGQKAPFTFSDPDSNGRITISAGTTDSSLTRHGK